MTKTELENYFTYHAPEGNEAERYGKIRDAAKQFALTVLELTPTCADQTVAIRKIIEANMMANMTIACNYEEDEG